MFRKPIVMKVAVHKLQRINVTVALGSGHFKSRVYYHSGRKANVESFLTGVCIGNGVVKC